LLRISDPVIPDDERISLTRQQQELLRSKRRPLEPLTRTSTAE